MTPPWPAPQPVRPNRGPLAALTIGLIATAAVAVASFVVGLSKPQSTEATYSPAEREAAKTQLCERYDTASRASRTDTNGGNPALARTSLINGSAIFQSAAQEPALDATYREAAGAVALAFQIQSSDGNQRDGG